MFYLEIISVGIAIIISLTIFFYNLVKKIRLTANRLLSICAFLSTLLFGLILTLILNIDYIPPLLLIRLILSLVLLISTLFLGFIQIYPYINSSLFIISGFPGYLLYAVTIFTDIVIEKAVINEMWSSTHGKGYPVFLAVTSLYLLATLIILFAKRKKVEYRAFKTDMLYLFFSLSSLFISLLVLAFFLPYFRNINTFINIGIILPIALILIIMSYAASNTKAIDMKRFYANLLFWILIFTILFIPVMLILKYKNELLSGEKIPALGIAIIIFFYLFMFFKFIKPKIEALFKKGYKNLADKLDDLFNPMAELSISANQESFWDDFFRILVDGIVEKFNVGYADCYLYNSKKDRFISAYSAGKEIHNEEINNDGQIVECVNLNPFIIYKPAAYYDVVYKNYKKGILEFFNKSEMEIIMPFFNHEKRLIGLLMLGALRKNRVYSKILLHILELYRIRFQRHLADALMLENVKATQLVEHDKMVVSTVKKKIIPAKLMQIKGIRISCFYINNSKHGGDYFDSIKIGKDKVGVFISDTSYSGIDSAIISLELYAVLHTPSKTFDSPDRVLNTMNRVISTSRFSNQYTPASCIFFSSSGEIQYSNAAFKPLVIFNPQDGSFPTYDSAGVPIGVDKESRYEAETIDHVSGSIGIIYSDGFVSAINEKGETYDFERTKDIIRTDRENSSAILIRNIYTDFKSFIKDKKQINDVSVILFKLE